MANPSKHVSWTELQCKDGTGYPDKYRLTRLPQLLSAFETIRAAFGDKPITILSAYRTPEYNKKIGGARFSQHIEGRALDLRPPNGISVDEFFEVIRKFAPELKIGGIGKYPTFVHIDTRPSDKLVIWHGSRTNN
jgi:uncharacterized protein YcbK (DUF882 family)